MTSEVYFFSDVSRIKAGANKFFEIIAKDLNFAKGKVGIKIHFGEEGSITHVNPEWIKDLGKYFDAGFVECNVLYRGLRTRKEDHLKTAKDHGFGFLDIDILHNQFAATFPLQV